MNHIYDTKNIECFYCNILVALGAGIIGFIVGLAREEMFLNQKGYYFTALMFGLFAVFSLQKSERKLENLSVTNIYYGICWF